MRAFVREALKTLGIKRLLLGVHDASLPADARDDAGRGAPLSIGGRGLLRFAHDLGFDGLQLGPQGMTSELDPSPYDGTIFSRNTLSIALGPLAAEGLISMETFDQLIAGRPAGADTRVANAHAHSAARRALDEAFASRRPAHDERLRAFSAAQADWLERDALYLALSAEHGEGDWLRWPEADRTYPGTSIDGRHAELMQRYRFGQLLAHEQHAAFSREAHALDLMLYGDLQIGVAHQDVWSYGHLFHQAWRMGAPPSRTNPEGQPWNYGVLDPGLYGSAARPGPVLEFLSRRAGKLLGEFDGLRIDHPHGLIDPWVYRAARPDQLRAVQDGSRLFSSPDIPELALFAIARADQLDITESRHADGWVRDLTGDQVTRYATLFDALVAAARTHGRGVSDLIAEVLSTQPYPVARVLERHGLGRFRVTQKANLADPRDVYRAENAAPADWIMVGNHDTEPIWRVTERWCESGLAAGHARYLAERLIPDHAGRASYAESIARDPKALARAKLAELFIGPAEQVMIFFTDLLGMREAYNRPGTISPDNWSLRIPPDYSERYGQGRRSGEALDLDIALELAMSARLKR